MIAQNNRVGVANGGHLSFAPDDDQVKCGGGGCRSFAALFTMDSGIVHDWTKGQSSTSVKTTGATQSSSSRFQPKGEQGPIWSGETMVADLRLESPKRAKSPRAPRGAPLACEDCWSACSAA